ncbi:GDSL esterase/lipase [Acorus calamus]|uniref:GDSL esterase/lipase n=1 Tax=Acorus calamus TaxID=4465 RepID=A0AAV9DW77_ACOCL|nr:GDSL esterase/lipase [Acorus calamus]
MVYESFAVWAVGLAERFKLARAVSLTQSWAVSMSDAGVPAIYVFGDSSADVGNNNYLSMNAAKANFPFNGIDFPGGVPTGRFGNGYVVSDYMDYPKVRLIRILPKLYQYTTGNEIPVTLQLRYFSTVVSNLTSYIGKASADRLLSESLFLISVGSNDILADFTQFGPPNNTHKDAYVAILISK